MIPSDQKSIDMQVNERHRLGKQMIKELPNGAKVSNNQPTNQSINQVSKQLSKLASKHSNGQISEQTNTQGKIFESIKENKGGNEQPSRPNMNLCMYSTYFAYHFTGFSGFSETS